MDAILIPQTTTYAKTPAIDAYLQQTKYIYIGTP